MKSYIYLGSPYSPVGSAAKQHTSITDDIKLRRFEEISRIGGELVKLGYVMFCPITQSHCLVKYSGLQNTDWKYWRKFDTLFLKNSSELFVATMDGWEDSVGLQAEIKLAHKFNKPIKYIDPISLSITKEPK